MHPHNPILNLETEEHLLNHSIPLKKAKIFKITQSNYPFLILSVFHYNDFGIWDLGLQSFSGEGAQIKYV